jgi:5-methylcytosine-specific restriction endonuclease McrA
MKRRKLTDEQVTRMQELRSGGLSYKRIGEAVGLSEAGVRLYLCPGERAHNRELAQGHKEETRAYNETYYKEHRKGILQHVAGYQLEHKEERHLYYESYATTHKEKINAQKAIYRAAHKEEAHRWRQDNAAHLNARNAARKAVLVGATIGNLAEIKEIYRRAKEEPKVRCYLCGELIPMGHRHVDHIRPVSKGGAHRPSNLAVTCDRCNESKGAKLPEEIGVLL